MKIICKNYHTRVNFSSYRELNSCQNSCNLIFFCLYCSDCDCCKHLTQPYRVEQVLKSIMWTTCGKILLFMIHINIYYPATRQITYSLHDTHIDIIIPDISQFFSLLSCVYVYVMTCSFVFKYLQYLLLSRRFPPLKNPHVKDDYFLVYIT